MSIQRRAIILSLLATITDAVLRLIHLNRESDDSENDDLILYQLLKRKKRKRIIRISGYVNNVVPRYNARQFRQHFRLTPITFENLLNQVAPMLSVENKGRPIIPPHTQLLAVLWLLATPDSFRSVGEKFDLGKSSLHDSFKRIVNAINNLAESLITWPTQNEMNDIKYKFLHIGPLPDVIGAIDCTHVPIKAPKDNPSYYITRKKEYAITLQAVCDTSLVFRDCFIGFAGSVHDKRIFVRSDLWTEIQRNKEKFFPRNEHILGDKAYPVLPWCISPYIDRGNLTVFQISFNKNVSKMRQVIERAFALLKGRFRRLKYLDMSIIVLIPEVILACCVLHNVCLQGCDENNIDFIEEGAENVEAAHNNREHNENIGNVRNDPTGLAKRDYLCHLTA